MINEEDRKDIVSTWVYHAEYSYPTPSVERDGILAKAIPFLEAHDIYCRGRFGMWKYEVSNTDHTLMQGVELVNRLMLNEPESTIGIKYESTLDGRNAASHERSSNAGSGDPKKLKANPVAFPSTEYPGKVSRGAVKNAAKALDSAIAVTGPGDKVESHISEEELGVVSEEPKMRNPDQEQLTHPPGHAIANCRYRLESQDASGSPCKTRQSAGLQRHFIL